MEGVPYASDFTVNTYWEAREEEQCSVNINVWLWVDWTKLPFGLKGRSHWTSERQTSRERRERERERERLV